MSEKKLSRRDFLRISALAGASSILAACSSTAPEEPEEDVAPQEEEVVEEPQAQEGTLLRYWSGWGGSYAEIWDQIQEMDEFKDALGANTFETKFGIGGEEMLTAVAGGDPPETGTNIQYLSFMARSTLLPIDDLLAVSNTNKDDFLEGNWNNGAYKGVQYGIPTQECFLRFGLNYNAKLVEEAGLDPDSPPETWDELYDWHTVLTKFDDAGNLLRVGINPYGAMGEGFWDSDGWMVPTSWGFHWFDENTKKFNINNEQMVDAFTTQKKFIEFAGVDNLASLYSVEGRDTWGGAYNAEVECALIEGYWHPGETAYDAPDVSQYNRATWLPVPESRRGVKSQGAGGHLWTFFVGSKNPEGMFKIAELMNLDKICDIFFDTQGWLPAVKSYLATADRNKYPGLAFYFESGEQATEWYAPAKCEITDFASTEYLSLKDKVNRDEMTAEEAAAELQSRCEEEYIAAGFGE
jgi:ABC-type glycerol-3-phosphate transport system substrate-binding protein